MRHHDDTIESAMTSPQLQHTDDVIRSKASLKDAVEDEDAVPADNDDDGPCDSSTAGGTTSTDGGTTFPAKPPRHTMAASCPTSPSSDVVRTSAEGRTCDEQEQHDSDYDAIMSSS